jgi:hypothetical protein
MKAIDGYRGVHHRARIRAARWLHPSYGLIESVTADCAFANPPDGLKEGEMKRPPTEAALLHFLEAISWIV